MTLLTLAARVVVVVAAMMVATAVVVLGWERIAALPVRTRHNLPSTAPYLGLVGGTLLASSVTRRVSADVSWIVGWNVTGLIYAIEGGFVAALQGLATPTLTTYFSFVYVYGYAFLLTFPIVAYLALEDATPLREACLAYTLNYAIGLCCYIAFIAYGPRNLLPDLVEPLMYTSWPQSQLLVSQVNVNTNVFPSLHSSLSVTVALLAYRTREIYPWWLYIAVPVAASVAVATMYLGIHWGVDVLAGAALAAVSVSLATRLDARSRPEHSTLPI